MKHFFIILAAIGTLVWSIFTGQPKAMEPVIIDDVVAGTVPTISYRDYKTDTLGAPFRPSEFKTYLNQSLTEQHAGTTIKVSSITTKDNYDLDTSILGDLIVLHINPGASNAEIVLCTGLTTATKTFTGCTFGYRFDRNATVAANIKAHAPGETVIISDDDHYLATQYPTIDGANTFTGRNEFSTTTDATTKVYVGNEGAYVWYNTGSNSIGFASSTAGTEWAFNENGTTFTAVRPIVMTGGELKLATSTPDFKFVDSLTFAINTSSPFTFAGNFKVSTKVATSTLGVWLGSGGTANNIDLTGGDLYVQDDVEIDGSLFVTGNSTSTASIDLATLCFSGTNCVTSVYDGLLDQKFTQVIADALNFNGVATTTIPAGLMGTNGLIRIKAWGYYTRTGAETSSIKAELDGSSCGTMIVAGTGVWSYECEIGNRNSASSQIYTVSGHATTSGFLIHDYGTMTVNTALSKDIRFYITSGTTANNLEGYYVELIRKP